MKNGDATAAKQSTEGDPAGGRLSFMLVLVFAVTCGLSVANIYYAQPLLDAMARDLSIEPAAIGIVVTLTQVGYALGLMLIVPLGDLVDRRHLILWQIGLSAVALVVVGTASSAAMLLTGMTLVGILAVVVQVVVAFAAVLAKPAERGRAIGTVTSGVVAGILLARFLAGALADIGRMALGLSDIGRSHARFGRFTRTHPAPKSAGLEPVTLSVAAALDRCTICPGADPARAGPFRVVYLRECQRLLEFDRPTAFGPTIFYVARDHRIAWHSWRCGRACGAQRRPPRRSGMVTAHHRIVANADARSLGSDCLPASIALACGCRSGYPRPRGTSGSRDQSKFNHRFAPRRSQSPGRRLYGVLFDRKRGGLDRFDDGLRPRRLDRCLRARFHHQRGGPAILGYHRE
jgi:hypothetical protein